MTKAIYGLLIFALFLAVVSWFVPQPSEEAATTTDPDVVACPLDAQRCPDGVYVGRSGPNCEFVCPALPADTSNQIEKMSDLIVVSRPGEYDLIRPGQIVSGSARGPWFFEGSFPVTLIWDGKVIYQTYATAEGDWMTEDFVPFSVKLDFDPSFVVDANGGDGYDWPLGSLILKKDNPSGLPEHDAALEIPVRFAP